MKTYCEDCGEKRPEEKSLKIYCEKHLKENTPKKTDSELREEIEIHLDNFYGDDLGQFLPYSKTKHVADYFQQVIHQREQQIYAELMEKIEEVNISTGISAIAETDEYANGWNDCRKRAFESNKNLKETIINNIFKHD